MSRRQKSDNEIKEERQQNLILVGDAEPQWPNNAALMKDSELDGLLGHALNWYRENSTPEKRQRWLVRYMKKENFPEEQIETVEKASERVFLSHPVGQIARCFIQGAPLPDKYRQVIRERVKAICEQVAQHKHKSASVPAKKSASRVDPIVQSLISTIETRLDDFILNREELDCNYKDLCDELGASKEQALVVAQRFNGRLEEMKSAFQGFTVLKYVSQHPDYKLRPVDQERLELNEAYSTFDRDQIWTMVFYFKSMADQANEVERETPKQIRKTRAVKVKDPTRKVLKQESFKLGTKTYHSLDPSVIIGAQVVWVFNSKWRRLGRYIAKDAKGLEIKPPTSVANYDEDNLKEKIIRQGILQEVLNKVLVMNKERSLTFLEKLPGSFRPSMRPRLNNDVVIMKAIRD